MVLDRQTFRVLASETRIDILKRLDAGRRTVSDLARDMGMNKATLFEHLEQMVGAGLVRKEGEEERQATVKPQPFIAEESGPVRKWVYYHLTWKGKNLLHPERVRLAVSLAVAAVAGLALITVFLFAFVWPSGTPAVPDREGPGFGEFILVPSPDESSSSVKVEVAVTDRSGVKAGSPRLDYGFGAKSEGGPDILAWQEAPAEFSGGALRATLSPEFGLYARKFLYLRATAADNAGNTNTTGLVRRVAPLAGPDLSVEGVAVQRIDGGSYMVSFTVRNTGTENGSGKVSVYTTDFASGGSGVLVGSVDVSLVSGAREDHSVRWNISGFAGRYIAVVADEKDLLMERSEENNRVVVAVTPAPGAPTLQKTASGTGRTPGFEAVALAAALAAALGLMGRIHHRDTKHRKRTGRK